MISGTGISAIINAVKAYYLIAAVLTWAAVAPRFGQRALGIVARWLARLAVYRVRSAVAVFIVGCTLAALPSLLSHPPAPKVADEFGYLLLGETFRLGRVANPTHPLWQHFESLHIIHQPTYTAKYPPAQGLVLLVGNEVGHPIIGIILSCGLMSAAIYWALRAWLRPLWALLGGFLAALHPLTLFWGHTYWGGTAAAIGGAIAFGTARRLACQWRPMQAVVLAFGFFVLANSRPYEGFVVAAMILGALLVAARGQPPAKLLPPAIAFGAACCLILLQLGWYNKKTTGDPLTMPYMVHERTYGAAPLFAWQKPVTPPTYRHQALHDLHAGEASSYRAFHRRQHSFGGFFKAFGWKSEWLARAYLWSWVLVIPLLGYPWAFRRDPYTRVASAALGLFGLCMFLGTWVFPHYAAPAFSLFLYIVIRSLRWLRLWVPGGRPVGLALARGTVILCVLTVPLSVMRLAQIDPGEWSEQRYRVIERLTAQGGQHLVIVRYAPGHNPNREWVYNAADIDRAPIIWAREMAPERNRELLDYFAGRQIWLIEADAADPRPVPYPRLPPTG